MAKKAKSLQYPTKKGSTRRNDNTAVFTGKNKTVKTISSEDSKNVGRPGFTTTAPGIADGKASVNRVMRNDPAVGLTQPQADKITDTHVDLIGSVNPRVVSAALTAPFSSGRKKIRAAGQRLRKR